PAALSATRRRTRSCPASTWTSTAFALPGVDHLEHMGPRKLDHRDYDRIRRLYLVPADNHPRMRSQRGNRHLRRHRQTSLADPHLPSARIPGRHETRQGDARGTRWRQVHGALPDVQPGFANSGAIMGSVFWQRSHESLELSEDRPDLPQAFGS